MIWLFVLEHYILWLRMSRKKFTNNAKKNTNIGGIHIIQIFTDVVPASEDIPTFAIGLTKDGEIKELYTDCVRYLHDNCKLSYV